MLTTTTCPLPCLVQRRADIIASIQLFKDATGREADARKNEIQELNGEILELKLKNEGYTRDSEEFKRLNDGFERDMEEIKRQISHVQQQSIETASKHNEDTATKFEAFVAVSREIRELLPERTSGSISRQKYAPARARLECVSQDSASAPPNRSVIMEQHTQLPLDFRQLGKRYSTSSLCKYKNLEVCFNY